ncbi:hypothetical protein [Novosphingobium sp.]|uniref:hypothetical protein n=1 Tax=Novosphingobium sp. TaxID=1874826 RepID=UPI00286DC0BB|nr:hypothetical protein [Novosphingobium sp.]
MSHQQTAFGQNAVPAQVILAREMLPKQNLAADILWQACLAETSHFLFQQGKRWVGAALQIKQDIAEVGLHSLSHPLPAPRVCASWSLPVVIQNMISESEVNTQLDSEGL